MLSPLTATAAASLPVLMVWAAAVDIVARSIPNTLVLVLAGCFAAFAALAGISAGDWLAHVACASAVLTVGFVLFSYSLIGGGDAKLLAGASLWFGFDNVLPFLAAVALAGGVLSLCYLTAGLIRAQLGLALMQSRAIPYGAAIAAGALAVVPDWLAAL